MCLPVCVSLGVCGRDAYKRRNVPKDGNCFWHALSVHTGVPWQEVKSRVLSPLNEDQLVELASTMFIEVDYMRKQLEKLREPNVWADIACMYLAAKRMRIHVVVVQPDGKDAYGFVMSDPDAKLCALEL
eukprot:6477126-Amphidinium_carterae.1